MAYTILLRNYAEKGCDLLQDNRPFVREGAPCQTKPQLSWLQPKSGYESQWSSMPKRTYRKTMAV